MKSSTRSRTTSSSFFRHNTNITSSAKSGITVTRTKRKNVTSSHAQSEKKNKFKSETTAKESDAGADHTCPDQNIIPIRMDGQYLSSLRDLISATLRIIPTVIIQLIIQYTRQSIMALYQKNQSVNIDFITSSDQTNQSDVSNSVSEPIDNKNNPHLLVTKNKITTIDHLIDYKYINSAVKLNMDTIYAVYNFQLFQYHISSTYWTQEYKYTKNIDSLLLVPNEPNLLIFVHEDASDQPFTVYNTVTKTTRNIIADRTMDSEFIFNTLIVKDQIYIIGPHSFIRYNLTTNKWQKLMLPVYISKMITLTFHKPILVLINDDVILMMAGLYHHTADPSSDHVHQYTISTNTWTILPFKLPLKSMYNISCIYDVVNELLIVVGGNSLAIRWYTYNDDHNKIIYARRFPTLTTTQVVTRANDVVCQDNDTVGDNHNNGWMSVPSPITTRCLGLV